MPLPKPGNYDRYTEALRTQELGTAATAFASSAGSSISLDVSVGGPVWPIFMTSTATITSMTISGQVDGQIIDLLMFKTIGSSSVSWPPNFRWAGNAAPVMDANASWNYLKMRYSQPTGLWLELTRSLNIPGS